jgi:hypothetical protein
MSARNVLFVGYYLEDTRTLVHLARALCRTRGARPVFLIGASGGLRAGAMEFVRAQGFEVVDDLPPEAEPGERLGRNPFRSARILREANRALANRILDRTAAKCIVCTTDAAQGNLVAVAAERGIPSLYVQWTEVHSEEVHRVWDKAEIRWADAHRPPLQRVRRRVARVLEGAAGLKPVWPLRIPATCLALPGEFYRDMCVHAGLPVSRLHVTGNIQCDEMHRCAHLDARQIAEIRASVGVRPTEPFLLYAREHVGRLVHLDPASARFAEETILTAMRTAHPRLPRVVKMHPKEGDEERARIRAIDPDVRIVGNETDVGQLIAASALLVSTTSSTLLWAVGIDRPAISAYFWKGVDEFKMRRHWTGVEQADTADALVTALRKNLDDPDHAARWRERRAECRRTFLMVDGKSVERITARFDALVPC